LGKSTIYHYFESKEELFYETIKNEIKEYTDGINLLLNSENRGPIQSLKLYFQNKAAIKTKFPLVFQIFLLIISGQGN
jgi:AcrR family transcriptional regulator